MYTCYDTNRINAELSELGKKEINEFSLKTNIPVKEILADMDKFGLDLDGEFYLAYRVGEEKWEVLWLKQHCFEYFEEE